MVNWANGAIAVNSSTYTPVEQSRDESSTDLSVAAGTQGMNIKSPGLRLQGSCSVFEDHAGLSRNGSLTRFTAACNNSHWTSPAAFLNVPDDAGYRFCTGYKAASSSALAWINTTNSLYSGVVIGTAGMVACNFIMSFGIASLSGATREFSSFAEVNLPVNTSDQVAIVHPLWAALHSLFISVAHGGNATGRTGIGSTDYVPSEATPISKALFASSHPELLIWTMPWPSFLRLPMKRALLCNTSPSPSAPGLKSESPPASFSDTGSF